jgi:hypothetical protein
MQVQQKCTLHEVPRKIVNNSKNKRHVYKSTKLTTHVRTTVILLNADTASRAWTCLCGTSDLVLRFSKVRITMSSHVIVPSAGEAVVPGRLMVETHLEATCAAGDAWVARFIQFAVGAAIAETPSEVWVGGYVVQELVTVDSGN